MKLRDLLDLQDDNPIAEWLLKFIQKDNILDNRVEDQLLFLDKKFKNHREVSKRVIQNIDSVIENDPQLLIQLIRDSFSDIPKLIGLCKVSIKSQKKELGLFDKMEMISNLYELSGFLKFGAYLLSDCRVSFDSFKVNDNKNQILKYYTKLGLDKKDKDNLRSIRNTTFHLLEYKNNEVILKNGKSISNSEIDKLYEKFDHIYSWWMTLFFSSFVYNLKLGILVLHTFHKYGLSSEILDSDLQKSIITLFPEVTELRKKKAEKHKSKKSWYVFWRVRYHKLKGLLFNLFNYEDYCVPYFLRKDFRNNILFFNNQRWNLIAFFEKISKKTDNTESKQNLLNTAIWMRSWDLRLAILLGKYDELGSDLFLESNYKKG